MRKLHWKLYIPLVTITWLIIGITIVYFVSHEKQRQRQNLENRLLNVNNTVIDAYERGDNLQNTVNFIRFFVDNTTLDPLRITVYDHDGNIVADNFESTIHIYDQFGEPNPELMKMIKESHISKVQDMTYAEDKSMVNAKMSMDGEICSLAALPYKGEVIEFLKVDTSIWIVVVALGLLTSIMAWLGVRAVCRNVYLLRDFADSIASDRMPENIDKARFSNDELGQVSRNLLTLYREKIHAEQAKLNHERQISLNIAHELNTPVSIIKSYADTLIEDDSLSESARQNFINRIQQNADRLANLVKDLSLVLRLDETGKSLPCDKVSLNELVDRLEQDIREGHINGDMTFNHSIPSGCNVIAHESLLMNAFLNLVYNAATHSGGTAMSLDFCGDEDGFTVLKFSDNGNGVEQKHIDHLFDLFYRAEYGRTRKTGGAGLGLPMVRRVINAMGGSIKVDNSSTGGLVFTIRLRNAGA
ncbi:MAG: HAMP domain-containing histidine kinase [Muribaculaceae bacterium]|nr:HAMP domain-containing histidine kinase [Muribaculaceae bacterium]